LTHEESIAQEQEANSPQIHLTKQALGEIYNRCFRYKLVDGVVLHGKNIRKGARIFYKQQLMIHSLKIVTGHRTFRFASMGSVQLVKSNDLVDTYVRVYTFSNFRSFLRTSVQLHNGPHCVHLTSGCLLTEPSPALWNPVRDT